MSEQDPMVDEFDTVAAWTVAAVEELGADHALPAACRGSGSPAALDWLADAIGVGAGSRLLDSGAGVGGPAAYVARERDAVPVLAEPMTGACWAARQLFDAPVVAADGLALPFPDASFDCAWSLGVLCTVEDKPAHLAELRRAVVPGGGVGLLVYVRTVDVLPTQPEGNHFPDHDELLAAVAAAGLVLVDEARLADLPGTPEDWQAAADAVDATVERAHRDDPRWARAQAQQEEIADLIGRELVVGVLVACRAG
ncbi:class I SAM-dependent methyltransferase [Nocardioides sp. NPDC092400]|uniref:class I SAM-dependent methyltransferase n=1 Tax=Nocardioides sp. NPDC092400 TaxID=3155196 RepID=UPI00343CDCA0